MRRLLLAGAALLVLAAPANAHKVKQSPSEVRAYWTAERMRDAVPVEKAKRQERAKPGGGTTSSWSTVAVTNWTTDPSLLAHGKVFFSDGAYNYVCSGTLVQDTTGSIVWTAGHCVHPGGAGAYYTN